MKGKKMIHFIKKSLQGLVLVPVLALGVSVMDPIVHPSEAYAAGDCTQIDLKGGVTCADPGGTPQNLFGEGGIFTTVTNALLFIIGAVAVIMLIYGGLRYVLSGGDSSAVTAAKNTILYAIIGIIVAVLAFAAVNFVVTRFV